MRLCSISAISEALTSLTSSAKRCLRISRSTPSWRSLRMPFRASFLASLGSPVCRATSAWIASIRPSTLISPISASLSSVAFEAMVLLRTGFFSF